MPEPLVHDEVLGAIRLHGEQLAHLRRRTIEGLPPMLELSQWNPAGGHCLAFPFPDDPDILGKLISLLTHVKEQHGTV